MMFVSRHSERSEESTDLNKEAEKLFSEHAPALLSLSSSNNISASLPRTRCRGVEIFCHPEFISGSELVKIDAKVLYHVHFYISSYANIMFAPPPDLPHGVGRNLKNTPHFSHFSLSFLLMQTLRLPLAPCWRGVAKPG